MCTAATYRSKDFYFGRTLDYELSYGETVTVTSRNYPFDFRRMGLMKNHYSMIGMAHIAENYPLYYDAVNEKGLGMAGLNFVDNAYYPDFKKGKDNIAPFEFTPWILGQCASVKEARALLDKINLVNIDFSKDLPLSQLHWIIADSEETITVESVKEGLNVYDNPAGVLTNNPPFKEQMFRLNDYMYLSADNPKNTFCDKLPLHAYSRGMGTLGLPGDLSSGSRFVRATFVRAHSISGESESESVSQFFHILNSVDQPRGCCCLGDDKYEVTLFTSCCSTQKGIYYYTTYDNHQISAVDMNKEDLDGSSLISFPLIKGEQIRMQN